MQLSSFTAMDYLLLQSDSPLAVRFRDRERSILTLFWTSFHRLVQGKRIVIVMDEPEDLEYINYLLSKYGLKELSLILQSDVINHAYLQTKHAEQEKIKPRISAHVKDFKEQKRLLENLVSEVTDALYKLRLPQLGSIPVSGINDKLELGSKLPVDMDYKILKPPYTYEAYKSRKDLYEKLQSEYHPSFDYLRKQDPFNESISEVESLSSVESVLGNFLVKAQEVKQRYEVVERSILKKYENQNLSRLIDIKKKVSQVRSMITDNPTLTDTQVTKLLFHQRELYDILALKQAPTEASELKAGLKLINLTVERKLSNEFTSVQEQAETYLKLLNPHSDTEGVHDIAQLLVDVNNLSEELTKLGLLVFIPKAKSVSFYFQKKNLEVIMEKVEDALYFLSAHKDYFNWKSNDRFLTEEDHSIIKHLSKKNQFWGEAFEELFLNYYLDHSKPTLDSAQSLMTDVNYHKNGYLKGLASTLLQKHFEQEQKYAELAKFKTWSQALDNKSDIRDRYPLFVVSSDFYTSNVDRLVADTDSFIYFNHVPEDHFDEEWLSNIFLGYDPIFWELSKKLPSIYSEIEIVDNNQVSYNINRALKHLAPSEVNLATKYLGQELCALNPDFRLYQLRNASIISCLSDEKNVYLLKVLRDEGVKEIFNSTSAANLIPGLFHESTGNVFLLVEDGILRMQENLNLIPQIELIQQARTAGIIVISIDNYHMINNGFEMMEDLTRQIKKANGLVAEPAMA